MHGGPPSGRSSRTGELVATVVITFAMLLRRFDLNHEPRADLAGLVSGTAHKPFVYRVLLPAVIRLVRFLVPAHAWADLGNRIEKTPAIAKWLSHAGAADGQAVESLLALILMGVCLIGFGLSCRRLAEATCALTSGESRLLVLGAFVCLVPLRAGYIYDFGCLFLFTLCLACLAESRWRGYLAAFLFTSLAKETSLLLILFFAVHFRSILDRALYRRLLLWQCVLFAATRSVLIAAFWNNPGAPMEIHLSLHASMAMERPLLTLLFYAVGLGGCAIMVHHWKDKPKFLRDAATSMVPPMFVLYLVAGYPYEIRVFYEVYAVVFLLCACTVIGAARRRPARSMTAG